MRPLEAKDPRKTIQYTIYLGVFSLTSVSDFVKEFFKNESVNPNPVNAKVCYASFKLDCQGIYITKYIWSFYDALGIETVGRR